MKLHQTIFSLLIVCITASSVRAHIHPEPDVTLNWVPFGDTDSLKYESSLELVEKMRLKNPEFAGLCDECFNRDGVMQHIAKQFALIPQVNPIILEFAKKNYQHGGSSEGSFVLKALVQGPYRLTEKRLSQTEAILLYRESRNNADALIVAYNDYGAALNTLTETAKSDDKLQIETEESNANYKRSKLVKLVGEKAVAKLDKARGFEGLFIKFTVPVN